MYYVYVLTNEKGKIYIGYTSNIKERYLAHQRKEVKSTREGKWRLVYYEAYRDKKMR
ncbi:Excinuclease ABC C subunit domain protein [Thermoanaerobacter ethanolicus JW 200]|nr:Excinuclease ABC C subunit domain protein [Thermoanaerobacter ethanolicus JW 200]